MCTLSGIPVARQKPSTPIRNIFLLTVIPFAPITYYVSIDTEEYSLAQQYVFKLIKPGYMFQLYSHHQAYLQSLVELCMLNAYTMWDPSSKVKSCFTDGIKNINHSVG